MKFDPFDASISIKILILEFCYYWAGSLLTAVRYHKLFDQHNYEWAPIR